MSVITVVDDLAAYTTSKGGREGERRAEEGA